MSNDIFKVHEERDSRGRYVFYGPGVHEAVDLLTNDAALEDTRVGQLLRILHQVYAAGKHAKACEIKRVLEI